MDQESAAGTGARLAPMKYSPDPNYALLRKLRNADQLNGVSLWLCKQRETGKLCILKVLAKRTEHFNDVAILSSIGPFKHPNIVGFIEAVSAHHDRLYMEHCALGDMQDLQTQYWKIEQYLPEPLLFHCFYGVSKALSFLHYGPADHPDAWREIVHLDIMPQNIFLTLPDSPKGYPGIKVADFGCSGYPQDLNFDPFLKVGTQGYVPPAKCRGTAADDMFGLGARMFSLMVSRDPASALGGYVPPTSLTFENRNRQSLLEGSRWSGDLVDLVCRNLKMNPEDRPESPEICDILAEMQARYDKLWPGLLGSIKVNTETEPIELQYAFPPGIASQPSSAQPMRKVFLGGWVPR